MPSVFSIQDPESEIQNLGVRKPPSAIHSSLDPFEPVPHTTRSGRCTTLGLPAVFALVLSAGAMAADPYADHVVSYVPQQTSGKWPDPQVALGEPARYSFEPDFPEYSSVVSMMVPAYQRSQIVEIGVGGSLTVRFDEPIVNRAAHPFAMDLIVFGNSFFVPSDYTNWPMSNPASLGGTGAGRVEVSSDGVTFFEVPGALADGLFPTQGYVDADPASATPGAVPSDFHRPMNPALTLASFNGLTFAQALALYDGSGGGTPVDIAAAVTAGGQPAGLTSVAYVRITNVGASPMEIDAFAAVPEPMTALLLSLAVGINLRRARKN